MHGGKPNQKLIPEDGAMNQNTKDSEISSSLTPEQYRVTQENGTQRPFDNSYWDNDEPGLYVNIVSGEPLFTSVDKLESGCGWPSFTKPIDPVGVSESIDDTHGIVRIEVRSKQADSDLGHVFDDGPAESGGLPYCINSDSPRLIDLDELEEEGYGSYRAVIEAADRKERDPLGIANLHANDIRIAVKSRQ
jgi:peptide-methionine (R)-S-oxide reductase